MREIRFLRAVAEGLRQEMLLDSDIIILGEDIRHSLRGITRGLVDEFGTDRIIDTPISEAGFTGIGTGAAILGLRPVLEFQINEFVFFAFDQLVDQAQKFRYMSGGKLNVPVTYIIAGSGAKGGMAGQHSDNPYPYLLHAGMKTIIPSCPYDAKGLLVSAIRDNDPVAVFLPINILGMKGEVPEDLYTIPLGKGEIKKEGNDITIVATGHLVNTAIKVAKKLEEEGISVEVYDPRTLLPLDRELLKKSVAKTGKVVITDDSNWTCGFAAEVAAFIAQECFNDLKAPIRRLTRADVPVPFSKVMESFVLPSEEKLLNIIKEVIAEVKLYELIIPKVGMGITEVELTALNVKIGDKVARGDILGQIEMEKAVTDLQSEVSGVVREILFNVGDTIEVGSVICRIEEN